MRVAIATCDVLPEPDPDEVLLIEAFHAAGHDAEMYPWDTATADLRDFDCCLIRSTWNYYHDPDGFAEWLRRADERTVLMNPLSIVERNMHKRYLHDLRDGGVQVIPTVFVDRGKPSSLDSILREQGWERCVVKPAVSAASYMTRSVRQEEAASGQRFLDEIVGVRDAMVQQYMNEVDQTGERCLVWIDGAITHSIRKEPRFADGVEQVSGALEPTDDERAFAASVMARWGADALYARIDLIRADDGSLCLSELELIEPSLFLMQKPEAITKLVHALGRRLAAAESSR